MDKHNGGVLHSAYESDIEEETENRLRVSDNSQLAQLDAEALAVAAARACPTASTINIDKSSRVHIGPKIVSVVQNVDNNEKVKGRILGLELVSLSKRTRRLRCSVAVFLCWAFIVAIILALVTAYLVISAPPQRLDIDLPLPRYLVSVVRNTSKAERIACAISLIVLIVCISLLVYFLTSSSADEAKDEAPHAWNITREMWLAKDHNNDKIPDKYKPIRYVVINHSAGSECHSFRICAAEIRNLQGWFLVTYKYDIPYNFLIGNEGRVYEGRGWNIVGAHTKFYNQCTIGLGFIGDYRASSNTHSRPTSAQIDRMNMLLKAGVENGYLHKDYIIVGSKDIRTSESPGSNLYDLMQTWKHYNNTIYKNKTCEQIYEHDIENSTVST